MGLYTRLESFLLSFLHFALMVAAGRYEAMNIWRKRHLWRHVRLTKEQKKSIDTFYKDNYGKKVHYWWHRLYQSYTGRFDAEYLPEYIFSIWLNNDRIEAIQFANKNILSVLFSGGEVNIPQPYVMKIKGHYYDGLRNPISKDVAIKIVKDLSQTTLACVLKPSVNSSSGRDVQMLELTHGVDKKTNSSIEELFAGMKSDFVLQEFVKQHPAYAKLHPHSLNTLRVISYLLDDNVYVAPITMRIGRHGNRVDNAHAGGMFVAVSDDGNLGKEAYTEYQERFVVHPDTGVKFDGYHIPMVPEIIERAKKLHLRLPMLRFISWDFSLNDKEEVVLLEINILAQTVWFPQMAHGKAFFGENTARILQQLHDRHSS